MLREGQGRVQFRSGGRLGSAGDVGLPHVGEEQKASIGLVFVMLQWLKTCSLNSGR